MAHANSSSRRRGGGNQTHPAWGSSGRDDEKFHYLNNGLVLRVTSGDITELSADAVVAGEDNDFSGDGGVATALLKAGGKKYEKERKKMIEKITNLRIKGPVYYSSPGGGLKFKHVFHAVTVNRSVYGVSEKNDLRNVYQNLGKMAEEKNVRTIVTPLLGTGHEGRPMEESLQAVVDGLSRMKLKSLREVTIVEFKEEKVSEIRDKLQGILEAAAKGEQGPRREGQGDWKSPSSAAGSAPGSHGGKPSGGFRKGTMHGGSDSAANNAPQTSQSPSGKKSSTSQDTLHKETICGRYPKDIVRNNIEKYEARSQDTSNSHGSGTSPKKSYAQAAATDNRRNRGHPRGPGASLSPNHGHESKQADFGRGRGRGRGPKREDPHRDHRDNYSHHNPSASAPPSAEEGEPMRLDTPPANDKSKQTVTIVRMDQEEDSGDEEGTDDDQNEGSAAETGNWRGQSKWTAEKYGSNDKDESMENSEPPRGDHPPHQRQGVQTWSSSSVPDSQSQPSSPHTSPVKSPRSHDPTSQIFRRNGGDDDEDDDSDDGDKVNESSPVGHDPWSQDTEEEEDTTGADKEKPQVSHNPGGVGDGEGKMVVTTKSDLSLEDFPGCGTILIEYSFPNGVQGPQHPAPGQPYKGTFRRAFLPDNQEGRRVLELLEKAFKRKLTFQLKPIGPDQEWGVEFTDIPHKTSLRGGQRGKGYPDGEYLPHVATILASLGIK